MQIRFLQVLKFLFLSIVCASLTMSSSIAQRPYSIGKKDILYGTLLLHFNVTGYQFYKNKSALTINEINALSINSISGFDRSATNHYNLSAAKTSDVLLYSSLASPAFLLIDPAIRQDGWRVSVVYLEAISLTAAGVALIKAFVKRPRPFVYNPNAPLDKKLEPDAAASFLSGHTAMTSTAAFFAVRTWTRYHPNDNAILMYSAAALVPLTTGYFRYQAGKHFPTDVLGGFLLGAINVFIVDALHK